MLAGLAPEDLGPAPGPPREPLDLLLERVVAHLGGAFNRLAAGADPVEPLVLARLACAVGADGPAAPLFARLLGLMDAYEAGAAERVPGRPFRPRCATSSPPSRWRGRRARAAEAADAPEPTREEAEA